MQNYKNFVSSRYGEAGVEVSNTNQVPFIVNSHKPGRCLFYRMHAEYKQNWTWSCLINFI